ncbi:MAG: sulfotransferase domain-containing protein [Pseudomonadota bacterium]
MRRYIIIIGAMKSGTTTLFDVLAQHPEIAPASNKEPGFFAFEDIHAQGYDWFDGLFDFNPDQHRYRLEASTDYTKTPFVTGVWERMTAREDVEVKLIYIMRHPLRRMESHARHTERTRREVGQITSPRPSHSLDAGLSPVSLATSAYATQLKPYAAARAAGRLHCLTLEDLKGDPEPTLAKLWAFLDLDPPERDLSLAPKNVAGTKMRTNPVWQSLMAIKPLLALVKLVLPKGTRDRISGRFRKQVHTVEGRFKLTEAEESSLAGLYASDLAELRDSYGIETDRLWKL